MKVFRVIISKWLSLFTASGVVCWIVGAALAVLGTSLWYSSRPPGTLISMTEDGSVSRSGDGKLILIVKVDRRRYCDSDTERWLMRQMDHDGQVVPVWRPIGNIPGPPTHLGDSTYALELDIPPEWDKPGTFYVARTNFHCGLGTALFDPQPTQTPPMPINVAPPEAVP